MLVDVSPASFSTSLQFDTLDWCIKLAFASPWNAQTFIHHLSFLFFICLPQSLPFHSYFLVCFHFSLFSLPFLLSPLFPFTTSPLLSVSLLRTTPPTLVNISASFFPCNYVRPTLGSWGEEWFFFIMQPLHKDTYSM